MLKKHLYEKGERQRLDIASIIESALPCFSDIKKDYEPVSEYVYNDEEISFELKKRFANVQKFSKEEMNSLELALTLMALRPALKLKPLSALTRNAAAAIIGRSQTTVGVELDYFVEKGVLERKRISYPLTEVFVLEEDLEKVLEEKAFKTRKRLLSKVDAYHPTSKIRKELIKLESELVGRMWRRGLQRKDHLGIIYIKTGLKKLVDELEKNKVIIQKKVSGAGKIRSVYHRPKGMGEVEYHGQALHSHVPEAPETINCKCGLTAKKVFYRPTIGEEPCTQKKRWKVWEEDGKIKKEPVQIEQKGRMKPLAEEKLPVYKCKKNHYTTLSS